MNGETEVITLRVEAHPSGRWSLTVRQGASQYHRLDHRAELNENEDSLSFYRAVADYMGVLGSAGVRFTYQDMNA